MCGAIVMPIVRILRSNMDATLRASLGERGNAMFIAVVVVFLMAGVMATIGSNVIDTSSNSRRRADRADGYLQADAGVARFAVALQSHLATPLDSFTLNQCELNRLFPTGSSQSSVIPNAHPEVPAALRASGLAPSTVAEPVSMLPGRCGGIAGASQPALVSQGFTVRTPLSTNLVGYWQIVRVIPPNTAVVGEGSVVAWFRGWTRNTQTNSISEPRVVRAEYGTSYFSNYLLAINGPIQFWGGNAVLNGNVHTNGNGRLTGGDGNRTVHTSGTGSCTAPPGGAGYRRWTISATRGNIVGFNGSCTRATRKAEVNLLRFEDVVNDFEKEVDKSDTAAYTSVTRRLCNATASNDVTRGPYGTCVSKSYSGSVDFNDEYLRVHLRGTTVRWCGPISQEGDCTPGEFGQSESIESATGTPHPQMLGEAILFKNNIVISGTSRGRLTIATKKDDPTTGAAWVRVVGDSTTRNVGRDMSTNSSLGLIAQGDVFIGQLRGSGYTRTCGVRGINAAVVSTSGTLKIPAESSGGFSALAEPDTCANEFVLNGSLSADTMPQLIRRYNGGSSLGAGFTDREMNYDTALLSTPPPFFPQSRRWQVLRQTDLDVACLAAAGDPRSCSQEGTS